MVLVQEGLARNQEHPQQCGESLWPKRKIYRMAFGQYVSLFNAKAVAGQTGTVQLEKSLLKYLFYDLLRIANI
jgi:hypothetical protein